MIKKRQKEIFLEALENGANITMAAKKANISRATVYRHMQGSVRFKRKVELAQELSNSYIGDLAESKLLQNVNNNHFPSIKLALEKNHPKYKKKSFYERPIEREDEYSIPQEEKEESERFMRAMFGGSKKNPIEDNPWSHTNKNLLDQKDPDHEQEFQE